MKIKDRLTSRLYYISIILLLIIAYSFVHSIYLDIAGEKQSNKNFSYDFEKLYKVNFSVPVEFYLSTNDTTIRYASKYSDSKSGVISTTKGFDKDSKEMFNKTKSNPDYIKDYYVNNLIVKSDLNDITNQFDVVNFSRFEGLCEISPKEPKNKILLYFDKYIRYIFIFILVYQFYILFKTLNNNFIFNRKLQIKMLKIGYLFLICFIYGIVIKFLFLSIFHNIILENIIIADSKIFKQEILNAKIVPISLDYSYLLIGLTFVIFSKLFGYGYEVQKDNDQII